LLIIKIGPESRDITGNPHFSLSYLFCATQKNWKPNGDEENWGPAAGKSKIDGSSAKRIAKGEGLKKSKK